MKKLKYSGLLLLLVTLLSAKEDALKEDSKLLKTTIFNWNEMVAQKVPNGERRMVLNSATSTLARLHLHISTLKPGEKSGAPRLHPQEELLIVKEGTVEVFCDGKTTLAPAGSVIFFAAHSVTAQRNLEKVPATYYVINYDTIEKGKL
jgi:mannose-6-phosphate isomerase-like protein (cupin superfamily)